MNVEFVGFRVTGQEEEKTVRIVKWIEEHQTSNYIGSRLDVLWDLVVG